MEPTDEMGSFKIEVRRESFYLFGPMYCYTDGDLARGLGTVEFSLEDIPLIRAALDQAEAHKNARKGGG